MSSPNSKLAVGTRRGSAAPRRRRLRLLSPGPSSRGRPPVLPGRGRVRNGLRGRKWFLRGPSTSTGRLVRRVFPRQSLPRSGRRVGERISGHTRRSRRVSRGGGRPIGPVATPRRAQVGDEGRLAADHEAVYTRLMTAARGRDAELASMLDAASANGPNVVVSGVPIPNPPKTASRPASLGVNASVDDLLISMKSALMCGNTLLLFDPASHSSTSSCDQM